MLFLDTAASSATSPDWDRIGKSTVFDLVMNAQTETNEFIEDEQPTTDVMSYSPSISEELQTNKGDAAFDYIYEMFKHRPTGEEVKKSMLLIFAGNVGTDQTPSFDAWKCEVTLTLDHFDTVAEKIYFNIAINKVVEGTATVTAGVPSFTANS